MISKAAIFNMALAHLAVGVQVTDPETESTEEARVLRLFYDNTRDEALRDFPWPFALFAATLALVASDPTDEWDFAYRVPADSLRIWRIRNEISRVPLRGTEVSYRLAHDATGALIYTDQETPTVEYIRRIEDPLRYPPDFVTALSLLLASYAAPRLTGGDQFKLGLTALQKYELRFARAKVNALAEEQRDQEGDGDTVAARG